MLGLLADTQAAEWRRGASATLMRQRMRDLARPIDAVHLRDAKPFNAFAAEPATAVVIKTFARGPAAFVSLLGTFSLCFALAEETAGIDVALVSDPVHPDRSARGRFDESVGKRA
ncbi:MAG: hypothetical protein ACYDC2_01780 [Solirubrobacteraceae bacterium]